MKTKLLLLSLSLWAVMARAEDLVIQAPKTEAVYASSLVKMADVTRQADIAKGVKYLNEQQREQYRVVIKDGVVYNSKGELQADTHNQHANHQTYVMDQSGNFYLFDEHTDPKTRHSSILAGGPVAGAGEIQIAKQGHITYIDSDSGHYPSVRVFKNVLEELKKDGVKKEDVQIPAALPQLPN